MVLADCINLFLSKQSSVILCNANCNGFIPNGTKIYAEKHLYISKLMSNLEMSIKLYVYVIYRQNYYISIPKWYIVGLIKLTIYIDQINYLSIIKILYNRALVRSKESFFLLNYIETYKVSNMANLLSHNSWLHVSR